MVAPDLMLRLPIVALALCVSLGMHASAVNAQTGPSISPPRVSEPVAPKTTDAPPTDLTPAPKWKEGEPVRVRPDLKQSPKSISPKPAKKTRPAKTSDHAGKCPGSGNS